MAENERVNIRQRQAEGIAVAKARGVKFGRPKKYFAEEYVDIFRMVKKGEIKRTEAMTLMNVSVKTYYRILKEIKEKGIDLS